MRLQLKKSTTIISAGLCALSMLVITGAVFFAAKATPVNAQSANDRLITVYDRGTQSTFVSDKGTIKEALDAAGVALDERDAVEPAREEKLVAANYQVNIYRARPVTVVDGATRQKVVTPYQSADRIAKDAGIQLYPEDTTSLVRSDDFISSGAGLQMVVTRATPVSVDLFGVPSDMRTQAKTVGDMLKEKKITLGSDGRVSPNASTAITSGMAIRVWKEGIQTITVNEEVAFETEQIKDADRTVGYKEVQSAGKNGSRSVTYEVVIQNGAEVGRKEIASVTTTEPVKQVEVIGAKLLTPTNPTENQAVGKEMMLSAGYGEDQWPCLYNLWMRESGWRVNAGNPTSGAYGIPQSLPASKMAVFGADYATNARTQIAWGLNYIKGRYGTPCGAWDAFNSRSPHWY